MLLSLKRLVFILFITLPISFKIEIWPGVFLYPQEPVLLFIFFILILSHKINYFPQYLKPYLYYLVALFFIVLSTLFSFFKYIDVAGLFKAVKYFVYLACIVFLAGYNFRGYLKTFNRIALVALVLTLIMYVVKWLTFGGATSEYLRLTTWDVNYVPSGLSNLNFSLIDFSFSRSAGNHGIYGSYLVLVYLTNLYLLLKKREEVTRLNYILICLVIVNLVLLTSRESLLIFLIVNLFFFIKDLVTLRVKKHYLYLLAIVVVFIGYILVNDIDFGLISKIKHTIQSFQESGGEQNINLRFRVWMLILLSYSLFPFSLLIGYGYNHFNFEHIITATNNYYSLYKQFASVPESLFFIMLAYGGLFSLLLMLAFFFQLFNRLLKLKKVSALHELFLYFSIGVFISNNTGGSLMSDLFLAQFSLFYLFLNKWYVQDENFTYYSKG